MLSGNGTMGRSKDRLNEAQSGFGVLSFARSLVLVSVFPFLSVTLLSIGYELTRTEKTMKVRCPSKM